MNLLHVEHGGRGRPLLMLHGWALNVRVFDRLAEALGERRHVVRVDLPGHGKSAWDPRAATLAEHAMLIADEVLREIEPSASWSVLGWSLGGQIALELAMAAPSRIDSLVLIATTPQFVATRDWPHGMERSALESFAQRLAADWRGTVNEFLELQVRGSAEGAGVLRALQAALVAHGETDPAALSAGLEMLRRSDLRSRLGRVAQPCLVLAGQYDRIVPPKAARALAESLTHGRYREFRRAGHAPFLSHAREVADDLAEFVA